MSYGSSGINLRWVPIALGLLAAGFVMVRGCQEGPFGRRQVVGLTPAEENRLGATSFNKVLAESDVLPRSSPASQVVNEIGENLKQAAVNPAFLKAVKLQPRKFDWDFRVVQSRQVNAFCLPGGKVVVYTGILPVCQDENGLATVMGHEIGHALASHGAERMAQQQLVNIGQMAAASSIGDLEPRQQQQVMMILGAGAQFGVLLPYSRSHESEADHIGVLLMAVAGYDPRASVPFWGRMGKLGGSRPPEFASTHPNSETRMRDLKKWLPEAEALYKQSNKQDGTKKLPLPER